MRANSHQILAERLGKTYHVSPLRFKLQRLAQSYPISRASGLEEWMVAVANHRGYRVVVRNTQDLTVTPLPEETVLTNEELAVGFCQLQCQDVPQILRLAAQMISRGRLDLQKFFLIGKRERVEPVVAELARLALKVDPEHPIWTRIHDQYHEEPILREPLLHWSRLCAPAKPQGGYDPRQWVLVS